MALKKTLVLSLQPSRAHLQMQCFSLNVTEGFCNRQESTCERRKHTGRWYRRRKRSSQSHTCHSGNKDYDVVALGNLCVDVVVSFPQVVHRQF